MAGVRERKKTLTRESILTAAAHCFAHNGYEATRVEEIAELADIAVGTVYNYYPSKRELLFALLQSGLEDCQAAGAKVVAGRIEDPADSLVKLLNAYVGALDNSERRIWREGLSLALADGVENAPEFHAVYEVLAEQVNALLLRCRKQEMIAPVVSLDTAGRLVLNIFASQVLQYALSNHRDLPALRESLRREIYLTFRGLR